jgi:hypothetical protein
MFGLFNDMLSSSLNIVTDIFEDGSIKKQDIVNLLDGGLTILAISELTGIAEDVLNDILND